VTDGARQFSFDHSTQYFTAAAGSRFEALAAGWAANGLVAEWPNGGVGTLAIPSSTAAAAESESTGFTPFTDGARRYIGAGGLRPLCDFLAQARRCRLTMKARLQALELSA
jgi:hypothetical protein